MNEKDRLKRIEEELKKSSQQLFKTKPKEVEEELERETILGSPENLIGPDNKEE